MGDYVPYTGDIIPLKQAEPTYVPYTGDFKPIESAPLVAPGQPMPPAAEAPPMASVTDTPAPKEMLPPPPDPNAPPPDPKKEWGDVALEAMTNIPSSAGDAIHSFVQPFLHPIDTAKAVGSLAEGVQSKMTPTYDAVGETKKIADVSKERLAKFEDAVKGYKNQDAEVIIPGFGFGSPNAIRQRLQAAVPAAETEATAIANDPKVAERAAAEAEKRKGKEASLDQLTDYYKQRYGSIEKFKEALAKDPVGVMMDASTALTGAGGIVRGGTQALARSGSVVGKIADKTAEVVQKTGRALDPVNQVGKVKDVVKGAAGSVVTNAFGLTTGAGANPVRTAFEVAREGGTKLADTLAAMRGKVPIDDIYERARQGVQKMYDTYQDQYKREKAVWGANKTPLNFQPIEKAWQNLEDSNTVWGARAHSTIDPAQAPAIQRIRDVLDEWSNDPGAHNIIGLDGLKKKVAAITPDNLDHSQVRRATTNIANAIKKVIVKADPKYAKSMENFSTAAKHLEDVEKALSLGDNGMAHTAISKLQSVMRNNASTGYGHRQQLLTDLEKAGGVDIFPSIAGHALSSPTPRGLQGMSTSMLGLGGVGAGAGAHFAGVPPHMWIPAAVAAATTLAGTSPRIVGEGAVLAGRVQRGVDTLTGANAFRNGRTGRRQAMYQLGRATEEPPGGALSTAP